MRLREPRSKSRPDRDDTNRPGSSPTPPGPMTRNHLQPVRLEEPPDRLGDLLMALLADDEPVMRVRSERLVLRAEPLGQPLGCLLRDEPVQTGADHEPRDLGERPAIDGDPAHDLTKGAAALVRLLTEEVLDPQDVSNAQVAMVALELLRKCRPADPGPTVDVRHFPKLVLPS